MDSREDGRFSWGIGSFPEIHLIGLQPEDGGNDRLEGFRKEAHLVQKHLLEGAWG